MADLNKFFADNAALGMVVGFLLWLGKDFAIAFLKNDAAAKLADKDPSNDGIARAELGAASVLEKIPTSPSPLHK